MPRPELYPVKKIVGFDHQIIDAIEKWRGKQRPIPNASEAIRKLVEIGLWSAHRAVLRTKKATVNRPQTWRSFDHRDGRRSPAAARTR
jgi:hypothetical protein